MSEVIDFSRRKRFADFKEMLAILNIIAKDPIYDPDNDEHDFKIAKIMSGMAKRLTTHMELRRAAESDASKERKAEVTMMDIIEDLKVLLKELQDEQSGTKDSDNSEG